MTERLHGFWTMEERRKHINVLELTMVLFGLKCFASSLSNCDVFLRIDNTTAFSYINRMGGVRFEELNRLARVIWDFCEERNI